MNGYANANELEQKRLDVDGASAAIKTLPPEAQMSILGLIRGMQMATEILRAADTPKTA